MLSHTHFCPCIIHTNLPISIINIFISNYLNGNLSVCNHLGYKIVENRRHIAIKHEEEIFLAFFTENMIALMYCMSLNLLKNHIKSTEVIRYNWANIFFLLLHCKNLKKDKNASVLMVHWIPKKPYRNCKIIVELLAMFYNKCNGSWMQKAGGIYFIFLYSSIPIMLAILPRSVINVIFSSMFFIHWFCLKQPTTKEGTG